MTTSNNSGKLKVDISRIENLLAVVGPENEDELILQLIQDLRNVLVGLNDGLHDHDIGEIRAQTHVLISLAGAVEVAPLYENAKELNSLAQEGTKAVLADLGRNTLNQLSQLIGVLETLRDARETGAHA